MLLLEMYNIQDSIYICSNKYFEIEENIVYFDFIHDKKRVEARHESNNFFYKLFFFLWSNKQTFFLKSI